MYLGIAAEVLRVPGEPELPDILRNHIHSRCYANPIIPHATLHRRSRPRSDARKTRHRAVSAFGHARVCASAARREPECDMVHGSGHARGAWEGAPPSTPRPRPRRDRFMRCRRQLRHLRRQASPHQQRLEQTVHPRAQAVVYREGRHIPAPGAAQNVGRDGAPSLARADMYV